MAGLKIMLDEDRYKEGKLVDGGDPRLKDGTKYSYILGNLARIAPPPPKKTHKHTPIHAYMYQLIFQIH